MKKVLTVVKGLGINGISNIIFLYYENLDNSKVKMDFAITLDIEDEYRKKIEDNGSRLYKIKVRDKNPLKYISELRKIIRNNNYEVVHVHGNSSMIILEMFAALLGGAKVRIAHSHNTVSSHNVLSILLRPIFNMLCNVRLSCSYDAGRWMFGRKKFMVINNGIDMNKYKFSEEKRNISRNELGISNEMVIGHVGGFNYQKNHEKLIEIFKVIYERNRNTKLLLVGDGENKENIKNIINKYNLNENVIIYGISKDVPKLMHAMDVFVLPSRFEGLGCVLVEAQALGLPCIVSNNVPKDACFSKDVKYINLKEDNQLWATEILKMCTVDRMKKSTMIKNTMIKREYDIDSIIRKLNKIYKL